MTAENILQKRAKIRDFYVKLRGTDQSQAFNQARTQKTAIRINNNPEEINKFVNFAAKKIMK